MATVSSTIRNAADQFFGWVHEFDYQGEDKPLAFFLEAWIDSGDGILRTGGSFEAYARTVIHIVQRLLEQPDLLDFTDRKGDQPIRIPRRMNGIYNEGAEGGDLDPAAFQCSVFEYGVKLHFPDSP